MASIRLRLSSLPPAGGVMSGFAAAAAVAATPIGLLESFVSLTGAPAFLPMTAPLGLTARIVLALAGGVFAGATGWAALYLLFGPGGAFAHEGGADGMPEVRRADAHPDAPPRRPLSAADLGSPPPPIERDLPRDLDQPLAAYDPGAILASRSVVPLAPGERIASVELPPRRPAETGAPTIESMLARLESRTRLRASQNQRLQLRV